MTGNDKAHGFIRRHWLGEYSFPRSFWFHAILLGWLIPIATLSVLSSNDWGIQGRLASAAFIAIFSVFYPIFIWGFIGCARAANRYKELGGRRIWATGQSVVFPLLVMDSIYFFVAAGPIISDHFWMTFTGRYGPAESIVSVNDGQGLLLSGELREGSADALEVAIRRSPSATSVHLDSKGGLLQEAGRIAETISQHHMETFVDRECSSACTFIFLAGTRRCVLEGAKVGFHSATYARDISRTTSEPVAEYQRNLYTKAGLPQSFVDEIIATPNTRVWYPSNQELFEAHVITGGCR